ncbi:hypothetical protein AJ79_00653 [Helicocarpus griseus UAMH5409]|uniref:DUF6594 domain-containing protein n=1 Tax=Helicocarpus griseus UAMH5409 TaxID=1447875 RepID=A0A2B7YBQ4_9EURO|nr:hypothetical protein AJ79_00653 [Helicocarpus griseus UAMH5409]
MPGKSHKRDGSKKSSSSSRNPVAVPAAPTPPAVRSSSDSKDSPSTVKRLGQLRQRSKTYSAKPQTDIRHDEHPALKRSATAKPSEPEQRQPSPNVFEFLDKDDSEDAGTRWAHTIRARQPSITSSASRTSRRQSSASYSFNSDSGSYFRDHSPDRASSISSTEYQPATPPDLSLDAINWKVADESRTRRRLHMAGAYMTDTETILESPMSPTPGFFDFSVPESYYAQAKQTSPLQAHPNTVIHPSYQYRRPSVDTGKMKFSNANKQQRRASLDSVPKRKDSQDGDHPLLYRKFDTLNHRLLRHLQEDIAQMEEDLTILDEVEDVRRVSVNVRSSGRQKLLSTKHQDLQSEELSALQQRKLELVEKLVSKTEQYNRALCSYREVSRKIPTATTEEVSAYRKWIHEHPSRTSKSDLRFLAHDNDLILLGERPASSRTPNPIYATIVVVSAAILFPLLAFGVISEFFGRIAVVSIFGGATALFASNGPPGNEYLIDPQDGWRCAALYFGFMAAAAIII